MWLLFILLSTLAWAIVNILNSVLVHHYHKSPVLLSWLQSAISLPLLGFVALGADLDSSWAIIFVCTGISAYLADLWFFHAAHSLDISVLNIAWSILAIFLTIVGFFYFNETWTIHQSLGSALIIAGATILAFCHRQDNFIHTLGVLIALAALYVPYYAVKKAGIDEGVDAQTAFFWLLLGRELPSFFLPLFSKKTMALALRTDRLNILLIGKSALIVLFYFFAEYFGTLAYEDGPLSLVAIVANTQPLVVIMCAAAFVFFWPQYAPKELLSVRSLQIKISCFILTFVGLMFMPPY